VAIALILGQVDLARTADVLATAAPVWVGLMLALTFTDLLFRAWRWQRLLAPIHHVPYLRTLGYLGIGYFANNLLPARLGELVRSHYLGDREGISRATTLGTLFVERVVDTAMAVAIAATTLGFAAGAQAVGVQLTLAQAALLASGTALATAVPAGPGNLGTYDLAASTIAVTLGVPVNTAFAIALLTHASTLLVTSALG